MNDLSYWTSALGQDGWIAAALMLVFFVIVIGTMILLWYIKPLEAIKKKKPVKPFTDQEEQTALDNAAKESSDSATRVEEAEIFITYGLYKQAVDVLEQHLQLQPDDENAQTLLQQAQQLNAED